MSDKKDLPPKPEGITDAVWAYVNRPQEPFNFEPTFNYEERLAHARRFLAAQKCGTVAGE